MKELKNGSVKFNLNELNEIAIFASEAKKYYEQIGCPALAKNAEEFHDKIFAICESHGMYDEYMGGE